MNSITFQAVYSAINVICGSNQTAVRAITWTEDSLKPIASAYESSENVCEPVNNTEK